MGLLDKAKQAIDKAAAEVQRHEVKHSSHAAVPEGTEPQLMHKSVNLRAWIQVEGDQPPSADFTAIASAAVRARIEATGEPGDPRLSLRILSIEETSETPDEEGMQHA
jgi:hypothetical protein